MVLIAIGISLYGSNIYTVYSMMLRKDKSIEKDLQFIFLMPFNTNHTLLKLNFKYVKILYLKERLHIRGPWLKYVWPRSVLAKKLQKPLK